MCIEALAADTEVELDCITAELRSAIAEHLQSAKESLEAHASTIAALDSPGRSGHVMRLRIESVDGAPINDYRISDDWVEVRLLDPSGHPYPGAASNWRVLDDCDLQLHRMLGTVVWRWLQARLGTEASDLDRAA